MSIGIWIAITLVVFVFPATALTGGGSREPTRRKLESYAHHVGLPLTEDLLEPVAQRIRRRQRGMQLGGVIGVAIATVGFIIFGDAANAVSPALIFFAAGLGVALGGAWAIAAHRPSAAAQHPVVARTRVSELKDYLTSGERTGLWSIPVVIILGAIAGAVVLTWLPSDDLLIGLIVSALVLLTWCIAVVTINRVIEAPARNASELELAWDDAERAVSIRQVVYLSLGVTGLGQLLWLILVGQALVADGFYQDNFQMSLWITLGALVVYGVLVGAMLWGPLRTRFSGEYRGYEQRQLWPSGVTQ